MSGDRYNIADQNAMCFLTFTVTDWVDVFSRKAYKIDLVGSLAYCQQNRGLIINAWCIMTNHMHLIGSAKEGFRLSDIIRDFKKFTAKTIINRMVNGNQKAGGTGCCTGLNMPGSSKTGYQNISFGKTTTMRCCWIATK